MVNKRIIGYMIDGLEYHYNNFLALHKTNCKSVNKNIPMWTPNENISKQMKHEIIAYLNRMGQFYYFAVSNEVKKEIINPLQYIPTINHFIPFRHKQTAHNGPDKSKGENNIWMNQLDKCFSDQAIFFDKHLTFQIISNKKNENITLDLMEVHNKIISEANRLLSLLK